jgi:hypothetical protein
MWDQVGKSLNESTVRVLSQFASLLPGLLALIVALLLAGIFAGLVTFALRRFLRSISFDEQLNRWGFRAMAEWSPQNRPTLLLTRVLSWSIVLMGFVLGLAAFDATLTSRQAFDLVAYLPNVIAAVVIIVVGTILARYLARSVLIESVNMNLQYARLLSVGTRWMVMVLTAAMALEHLRIGGGIVRLAFGILFGGIVLALALALGLGSKDVVRRSLERDTESAAEAGTEEPLRHL